MLAAMIRSLRSLSAMAVLCTCAAADGRTAEPEARSWIHAGGAPIATVGSVSSPEAAALEFIRGNTGLLGLEADDASRFVVGSVVRSSQGVVHVALVQSVDGVPVFNGRIRVHLRGNDVLAVDRADVIPGLAREARPKLAPEEAVAAAMRSAGLAPGRIGPVENLAARRLRVPVSGLSEPARVELVWFASGDDAVLAWMVEDRQSDVPAQHLTLVDARGGEVLLHRDTMLDVETMADVFKTSPLAGPPTREVLLDTTVNTDPSTPAGWVDADQTQGNNVLARTYLTGLPASATSTGPPLLFAPTYTGDVTLDRDIGLVNLFYGLNLAHLEFYRLGFDEPAGNFQMDNFGRGGIGGDRIIGNEYGRETFQDADPWNDRGGNSAFYGPTVDGESALISLGIWDWGTPAQPRDSCLDSDLILHEFVHGVTTRMVGGPDEWFCILSSDEAFAIAEATSDFFAGSMLDDPVIAEYSAGDAVNGMRSAPLDADNFIYSDRCWHPMYGCEPHFDGEIWGQTLWELRSAFIRRYGFDVGRGTIHQLIVDALPLAPCTWRGPTFPEMVQSILMADQFRYGGANRCLLWTAFAANGIGVGARNYFGQQSIDSFAIPDDCPALSWAWQVGCAGPTRIDLVDRALVLPHDIVVTSEVGDRLDAALAAGPSGSPDFTTGAIPVEAVAGPPDVVLGDMVLQARPGDLLIAAYVDDGGVEVVRTARFLCEPDVQMLGHRLLAGSCDADAVANFQELPEFLDPGESAVLELDFGAGPEPLGDVRVRVLSSNPDVTISPPVAAIDILPARRITRVPVTTRFLVAAAASAASGDIADLTVELTAEGYPTLTMPAAVSLRLGWDYRRDLQVIREDFEPTSPTAIFWTHQATRPPWIDEWQFVKCRSTSNGRGYKLGGGDPACGPYRSRQGLPTLVSPPLRVLTPGTERTRLNALRYQTYFRLAGTDAISVYLANAREPVVQYQQIWSHRNASSSTGFEPFALDLNQNRDYPFPDIDATADVHLVFAFDEYDPGRDPPEEGFYVDDVELEWETVSAIPQATACVPACRALAAAPAAASVCPGDTLVLSGINSGVVGCAGSIEYRWSGGELGPPGPFSSNPEVTVLPTATTDYTLDVRCSAEPVCTSSAVTTVAVDAGVPVVNAWLLGLANALRVVRDSGDLVLDWSETLYEPRSYNVHETSDKRELDPTVVGTLPATAVNDLESHRLPLPAGDRFFTVLLRNTCTGASVVP